MTYFVQVDVVVVAVVAVVSNLLYRVSMNKTLRCSFVVVDAVQYVFYCYYYLYVMMG